MDIVLHLKETHLEHPTIAKVGDRPTTPHLAILISVVATFTVATAASIFEKNAIFVSLQENLGIKEKAEPVEMISAKLLASLRGKDENSRKILLDEYISKNSPSKIFLLLKFLFSKNDPYSNGNVAILIATKAAKRYKDKQLYLILAIEYMKGTSVEKNFNAAWEYLNQPNLMDNRYADFYRGLWWLDKSNPKMDLENSRFYLRKSAAAGDGGAAKILIMLEE